MASRIMMHVGGRERPLSLGAAAGRPSLSLNSAETPWKGLPLELHAMGPARNAGEVGTIGDERGVLVILEGRIEMVLREGLREVHAVGRPGSFSWISSERRRQVVSMSGAATALALNVPPAWFMRMGIEAPPSGLAARPSLAPDETVHSLAKVMRAEVAAGAPTGRLFAESISLGLLSYLVERAPLASGERARGNFSESQCRRLRAHIREHLGSDLGVAELAALVGFSPRHFTTLFRRAFGVSPHRYVLQQRLQEGARLIATGQDIARVALDVGFSSQSHFTSAFRTEFGVTPRRYLR